MKNILRSLSRRKCIGFCILFFLILYIAALIAPYYSHKKVSEAFKKQFAGKSFYSNTVGTERAAYITDNTDALTYRLKMIDEAETEIILSTFDFNADKAGKDVMSALLHAADRGVKVRVIVDGTSGFLDMRGDPFFQALAAHENISLKIYNPINLLTPWKLQARLHDKYVIIDNAMYLLGGRNTMNLFLGDYSSSKNIDRELFVYETTESNDSSLHQLRNYFESIWTLKDSKDYICKRETKEVQDAYISLEKRYEKVTSLYPEVSENWNFTELTMATNKISLLSNPIEAENKVPYMWYSIVKLMEQGQNITIYTPYIICGKEMYADLTALCDEGRKVDIITNDVASGANPFGCTDYLNQKENIWKTGVNVYEYLGAHSSHTKAVLIDDRMTILGSYNLDMRSTYQDTELMLAVDSPELNAVVQKEAARDKTYSRVMTDSGDYENGENYHPREMNTGKKIMYTVLRAVTGLVRRYL